MVTDKTLEVQLDGQTNTQHHVVNQRHRCEQHAGGQPGDENSQHKSERCKVNHFGADLKLPSLKVLAELTVMLLSGKPLCSVGLQL